MTFQDFQKMVTFHFMDMFSYMFLSRQRYTFRELLAAYSSQYSPKDLGDYWRDAMASELVTEGKKSPVVVHVRVSWILGQELGYPRQKSVFLKTGFSRRYSYSLRAWASFGGIERANLCNHYLLMNSNPIPRCCQYFMSCHQ